jgi:hypothetical protein
LALLLKRSRLEGLLLVDTLYELLDFEVFAVLGRFPLDCHVQQSATGPGSLTTGVDVRTVSNTQRAGPE